jgi:hypothetical protein
MHICTGNICTSEACPMTFTSASISSRTAADCSLDILLAELLKDVNSKSRMEVSRG